MFKVNNENTGCLSVVFIVNFEYYFTLCCNAFNFEHLIVGRAHITLVSLTQVITAWLQNFVLH